MKLVDHLLDQPLDDIDKNIVNLLYSQAYDLAWSELWTLKGDDTFKEIYDEISNQIYVYLEIF